MVFLDKKSICLQTLKTDSLFGRKYSVNVTTSLYHGNRTGNFDGLGAPYSVNLRANAPTTTTIDTELQLYRIQMLKSKKISFAIHHHHHHRYSTLFSWIPIFHLSSSTACQTLRSLLSRLTRLGCAVLAQLGTAITGEVLRLDRPEFVSVVEPEGRQIRETEP